MHIGLNSSSQGKFSPEVCDLWERARRLRNDLTHVGMDDKNRRTTQGILTDLKRIVDDFTCFGVLP